MIMITVTPTDPNQVHQDPLPPPFDRLVATGDLTEAQARTVVAALRDADQTQPGAARARSGLAGRLAEIGAYLGASLVVAAGVVVVAQQWQEMGYAVRVTVMAATTLALLAAAVVLVGFAHGRSWRDVTNGATLRRLCGTVFTLAALASFGTVLVAMLSGQETVSEAETATAFIVAGAVAFVILVAARLRADTPLTELGLVAASVAVVAGVIQLRFTDQPVAIQWTLLAVGLAWAMTGTFTRLLQHQTLVTSLGLVLALFGAATVAETEWSQRLALVTLMVVALAIYLVRPSWPYITAATVSAVVLTVTWVGAAVGAAVALLVAGLVVLVLAGAALWLHNRRRQSAATVSSSSAS
jgi:hypothetical protein